MKTIGVLCAVAVILAVGVESWGGFLDKKWANACVQELNLNKAKMVDLSYEFPVPDNNPQFNKMSACIGKKNGFLNADDTPNVPNVMKYLLEERNLPESVVDIVEGCIKGTTGRSVGQVSIRNYNCVVKAVLASLE